VVETRKRRLARTPWLSAIAVVVSLSSGGRRRCGSKPRGTSACARKEKGMERSELNWVHGFGCSLLRGPCGLSTWAGLTYCHVIRIVWPVYACSKILTKIPAPRLLAHGRPGAVRGDGEASLHERERSHVGEERVPSLLEGGRVREGGLLDPSAERRSRTALRSSSATSASGRA
jgi:hypothetical protein